MSTEHSFAARLNEDLMGVLGHLIMDCTYYSLEVPQRYIMWLPQSYANDPGCVSLDRADNFVAILSKIRQHLFNSPGTQQHYIDIAKMFHHQPAGDSEVRLGDWEPHQENFLSFVANGWPTFRSIAPEESFSSKVEWGCVLKGAGSANEVGILNSLVAMAEVVSVN